MKNEKNGWILGVILGMIIGPFLGVLIANVCRGDAPSAVHCEPAVAVSVPVPPHVASSRSPCRTAFDKIIGRPYDDEALEEVQRTCREEEEQTRAFMARIAPLLPPDATVGN